jgi:diguanylate cyclase
MAQDVEETLRGPQAYFLAAKALKLMEEAKVWPTPLNFEIWVHVAADPNGALGREVARRLQTEHVITEAASEELAVGYLPRNSVADRIRDAGDQLSRELEEIGEAIALAQKTQEDYGRTLAGASDALAPASGEPPAIRKLVDTLAAATRKVQSQAKTLEQRLNESNDEVSRLKENLEQAKRDATIDGLTNLANRKSFDAQFENARAHAMKGKGPLSLALLDIDHFKKFNDTWGHQTGDQVLRFVSSVIGRHAKGARFAARYGGEEFALLFPGEHPSVVQNALEEIREEIASRVLKRRSTNEDLGAVTISIGVATFKPGETGPALTERADAALYASKRNGRDRVTSAETMAKPGKAA